MNSTNQMTVMSTVDPITGETTLNVPQMDDRQRMRSALGFASAAARRRFPQSHGRIDAASRLIVDGKVVLHQDGTGTVQSESGEQMYHINGSCTCPDASRAPEGWCKHKMAHALARKACLLVKEWSMATQAVVVQPQVVEEEGQDRPSEALSVPVVQSEVGDAMPETPDTTVSLPEAENAVTIPAQFLYRAKGGKVAVYFAGLLDLAHRQGLLSLSARFISVTADLALAEATAMFHDGRTFTEAADATPKNVGATIAPHFARMALTRAKARALRDALNINAVSVEELSE